MNISKLKLVWEFVKGGKTGVIDYLFSCANNLVGKFPDATKDDIKKYLEYGKKILALLTSLSWMVPSKWTNAYTLTINAFADTIDSLSDLQVTQDELVKAVDAFRIAYAAWLED